MAVHDPDDASLERLCELAHEGAGRAASALGDLLGCGIERHPPRVHRLPPPERPPVAAIEAGTAGVFFEVEGGIGGVFAVLLPSAGRASLLRALLGEVEAELEQAESALREVGNILASHALSGVADRLGARVLPSLPVLASEAAEAVLASLHAGADPLWIECALVDAAGAVRGLLAWIPAGAVAARGAAV